MRILVYGAGVLGCELAHVLMLNKKNDVTLLARGEWKERIDQKGLVMRHWAQRKTTVERVRTISALEPSDSYDVIFIVVQAGQVADVLPNLAQNASEYFVFVGNNPDAKATLAALKRPADKIAFGFLGAAGHREHNRVVSVHAFIGMTVGGATSPLSGKFRQRLTAAFEGTKLRLKYYDDMDEWLKCHIAFIMPICYVCYALGGDMSKMTKGQRGEIIDAAFEACMMLKTAGVPVNDEENTSYYRAGSSKRALSQAVLLTVKKTPLGRLCVSDHAMRAVSEMHCFDTAFEALRASVPTPMPTWDKLRAAMPPWDELEAAAR